MSDPEDADRVHAPTVPPFSPGGEFTVGVEDELLLVDASGDLSVRSHAELIAQLQRESSTECTVSREIFASQIEFGTPVCESAAGVVKHLARARSALRAAGQRAIASGVHPSVELGDFGCTRSPRYDAIAGEFAGVLRTPTAAFQVHVGLPDTASLVSAYRGIRNHLPVLRALSASSPFWHGRDSGLATSRSAIVRSYPRIGPAPVFRTYGEYEALVTEEMWAAEVRDYTYVCWEVRPHPRFGTLEVRAMDAQPSLDVAAGLVALVQGAVRYAVEQPPADDLSNAVLSANDFRVLRYGVDTRIVDVDGRIRPVRELVAQLVQQARDALADAEKEPLDALSLLLDREPEYERHRRIHARSGMGGLHDDLMTRTVGCG